MAAHAKLSESELNARYIAALARFSSSADWRAYLALAEEFRALDTYRDSAQLYDRCIKAASAPAYREIRETLNAKEDKTVEDYREAVRVLALIQDYSDAREFMRVCNVRANVLLYDRALALVTNSDATTDEIGQAVEIFRDIKSFRNCRELLERYDKYYCERVYAEASELMQKGHVYSEFDEAFALFSRIPQYGDAVELAAVCKKKADKLRPRQRPVRQKPAKAEKPRKGKPDGTEQTERIRRPDRERPERRKDETSNGFLEVWHTLDVRVPCVVCRVYRNGGRLGLGIENADCVGKRPSEYPARRGAGCRRPDCFFLHPVLFADADAVHAPEAGKVCAGIPAQAGNAADKVDGKADGYHRHRPAPPQPPQRQGRTKHRYGYG